MSIINTIRIEILGQKDINTQVVIDRAIPPLLANSMSSSEWDVLCNQVDNALSPIEEMRTIVRGYQRMSVIFGGIFFVVLIGVGLSSFLLLSREMRFLSAPITSVVLILGLVPTCAINAKIAKVVSGADDIMLDLQRTLEAESAKYSNKSFQIKKDQSIYTTTDNGVRTQTTYYIEAQLADASIPMGGSMPTTSVFGSPGFNSGLGNYGNSGGGSGLSAAQRLQELKGIKHLITEEEYQNKKDAILASV